MKTNKLFVFKRFFSDRPFSTNTEMPRVSLHDSVVKLIEPAYSEPRKYGNIKNLRPTFELGRNMSGLDILSKLPNKKEDFLVDMSQIEKILIQTAKNFSKINLEGKLGLSGKDNLFPVVGKGDFIYFVKIFFSIGPESYVVSAREAEDNSVLYDCGTQVFINNNTDWLPKLT